jgi:hypothetical protein
LFKQVLASEEGLLGWGFARAEERDKRRAMLGNPPQLWRAVLAYGQVEDALGRREEARFAWREGLQVVSATADALPDENRELLRRSAAPAALAELA